MRKNACFARRRIKVFYSHMIKFFIRLSSSSDISSNDHYSIFNQQYFLNSLKSESKRRSLRTNKISQVFHQRGSSMTSLFFFINSFYIVWPAPRNNQKHIRCLDGWEEVASKKTTVRAGSCAVFKQHQKFLTLAYSLEVVEINASTSVGITQSTDD